MSNDSISGTVGNDTLTGETGSDTIEGGGGDDLIYGDTALNPAAPTPKYTYSGGKTTTPMDPIPGGVTAVNITDTGNVTVDGDTYGVRATNLDLLLTYNNATPRTGTITLQDLGNTVGEIDQVWVDLSTFSGNFTFVIGGNIGTDDILSFMGVTNVLFTSATTQQLTYIPGRTVRNTPSQSRTPTEWTSRPLASHRQSRPMTTCCPVAMAMTRCLAAGATTRSTVTPVTTRWWVASATT
jgi:hypothetical protein